MIARLTNAAGRVIYVTGAPAWVTDQAALHGSAGAPARIDVCPRQPTRDEMMAGALPAAKV